MSRQNYHEKNFFVLTAVIVVMLGLPTISSLFSESLKPAEVVFQEADATRAPASAGVETVLLPNSVTIDIDCGSLPKNLEVSGSHLRIKSKHCNNLDPAGLSVVNKSNGFTASIFPTRDNQFTTDFMDLSDGINAIEMKTRNLTGTEEVHAISVNRRSPAASE